MWNLFPWAWIVEGSIEFYLETRKICTVRENVPHHVDDQALRRHGREARVHLQRELRQLRPRRQCEPLVHWNLSNKLTTKMIDSGVYIHICSVLFDIWYTFLLTKKIEK